MCKGRTKAISIGNHKSIFKTRAKSSSAALERNTILEVLKGSHSRELASEELNNAKRLRGHLARVREDAWDKCGSHSTLAVLDLKGSVFNQRAVLLPLNGFIGGDRG